jgi:uncharacterized protein YneF (UPF0154 family)
MAGIVILSIIAGLVVVGGFWIASRDTKPQNKHPNTHRPA